MMFIDCETIPIVKNFRDLDPRGQDLFLKKCKKQLDETANPEQVWVDNAALHAEFGRVLCVSMGVKKSDAKGESVEFRVKSLADRDEKQVFLKLTEVLLKENHLSGHNIKSFDLPFLFRRLRCGHAATSAVRYHLIGYPTPSVCHHQSRRSVALTLAPCGTAKATRKSCHSTVMSACLKSLRDTASWMLSRRPTAFTG